MRHMVLGTAQCLSPGLFKEMARYRHRIFVDHLGWKLRTEDGMELDQFDRADTLYVISHAHDGGIQGIARLLPTDKPYLLGEVFPQLLGGQETPHSACVWELSRFAAMDPNAHARVISGCGASVEALALLDWAMAAALDAGARDLVTVSPLGVERLLQRAGIVMHRIAPPQRIAGHALFACRIELAPSLWQRARRRVEPAYAQ